MKRFEGLIIGSIIGAALGAGAVSELQARTKPPAYLVIEVNLKKPQAYADKFAAKVRVKAKAAGGRLVAVGGAIGPEAPNLIALEGKPPNHVVIRRWESADALETWWHSYGHKMVQQVGNNYASFRVFAVKGKSAEK